MALRGEWLGIENLRIRMILFPLLLRRRPPQVIAGDGLLSRTLGSGRQARTLLYTSRGGTVFAGAWYAQARKQDTLVEANVARGFVNALEPVTPDNIPLSRGGVVKGEWSEGSEQWLVLKVKIELEYGKMVAQTQEEVDADNLVVTFSESPRGEASIGEYGYAPLAHLKELDSGVLQVTQIAYFSYRHNTGKNQFGANWRHFFHVA
jgi:hypothetical protein